MKTIRYMLLVVLVAACTITRSQPSLPMKSNPSISLKNQFHNDQTLHRSKTLLPHLSKFFPSDDDAGLHQLYDAQLSRLKGKHITAWEKTRHLKDLIPSQASQQSASENVPSLDGLSSNSIISSTQRVDLSTSSDSMVQAWDVHYASGLNPSFDVPSGIVTDNKGNVYVTGWSDSSFSFVDIVTNKYNSIGTLLWSRRYCGPAYDNDVPWALAKDNSGNIYVAGMSFGGATLYDYVTIKYNTNGVEQWVARYDGPDHDWDIANAIAIDTEGNVYVGGGSFSSSTYYDYTTVKYNSNGVQQWVARYNGSLDFDDGINELSLDSHGNVYVTGLSNSLEGGADIVTIKYNPQGVEQWVSIYNGPLSLRDEAYAIAVDPTGSGTNVCVTGYSYDSSSTDYVTIKYDASGDERWVARYNGPGNTFDVATAIGADNSGNIYVGGRSYNENIYYNFCTIKYDSAGVEKWINRYVGDGYVQSNIFDLALDNLGNIYVTGISVSDFFPYGDYLTIKYRPDGSQAWTAMYNGPANSYDVAKFICVDTSGSVFVTGFSWDVNKEDDYATVKYSAEGGQQWVARYNGVGLSNDFLRDMTVDKAGNVYQAIDGRTIVNDTIYFAMILIKYSTDGVQQWINSYPNYSSNGVAIDSLGNVYVSDGVTTIKYNSQGIKQWTTRFDSSSGSPAGSIGIAVDAQGTNIYVGGEYTIKYNKYGIRQWAAHWPFPYFFKALSIDKGGNVYVIGRNEYSNYITIKYDSGGQQKWVSTYGYGLGMVSGLAVDDSGNVYVTGESGNDYATVKYNTDGVLQWAALEPGASRAYDEVIACDRSGNVYLSSSGSGTFKYNSNGILQWSTHIAGGIIALDACGNIYVSGNVLAKGWSTTNWSDILTTKYSPEGEELWKAQYDAFENWSDGSRAIGIDGNGNVYLGGVSRTGSGWGNSFTSTIKYTPIPILALDQNNVVFGDIDITCTKTDTISLYTHACITPNSISVLSNDPNFSAQALGSTASTSIRFLIRFHPQSSGPKSGNITFTHVPSGSFTTLTVSGTGVAAVPPQYSTQSIAFDTVLVGCQSERSFILKNNRCTPLNILSTLSTDSNFSINLPSATIAPFDNYKFQLVFAPLSIGPQSGKIVLIHDQGTSPDTIVVSGTGVGIGSEIVIRDSLGIGWQLVSLPVDIPCTHIMPGSFKYNVGYNLADTLTPGKGYWNKLKFPVLYFAGNIFSSLITNVNQEWNIIGSISFPIPITNITSQPEGILRSPFYGYTSSGYKVADTIKPGYGYWVKVSQAGQIILQNTPGNIAKQSLVDDSTRRADLISNSNILTITDSAGRSQKLYFRTEPLQGCSYELPPFPPDGIFDVRFQSGRMSEAFDGSKENKFPILISSAIYPVTITWELLNESISVFLFVDGKETVLNRAGKTEIGNPKSETCDEQCRIIYLRLSQNSTIELPKKYVLNQNYPNPFNPTTRFEYALPEDAHVTLKIYDVLGREVATVVDEYQEAGYRSIDFDASSIASGIYFYKLEAGTFSETKKMLIMK